MQFVKSESRSQPSCVEAIAGDRYLIRRNIAKETREDTEGNPAEFWVYDEAVVSLAEYAAMSAVEAFEAKRENEIIDEYTLQLMEEGVL